MTKEANMIPNMFGFLWILKFEEGFWGGDRGTKIGDFLVGCSAYR